MIEHVYHDGSVGFEYEPGDLVRRVRPGLLSKPGDWGVVRELEHHDPRRPCRHTAMLAVKNLVTGHCSFRNPPWDFRPFSLPEGSLGWRKLTDRHSVFAVCPAEGGGYFFAVRRFEWDLPHEALLPVALIWGGRESRFAQRELSRRATRIELPRRRQEFPFVAEVMEA